MEYEDESSPNQNPEETNNNNKGEQEQGLIFGYWLVKFKGEAIRYLLHYISKDLGPWQEYNPKDQKEWMKKKIELSKLNPMVTIPYIKSKESVISRPGSIMMALCMKANRMDLLGDGLEDAIKVRSLQSAIDEIRIFVYEAIKLSKADLQESYEEYWQGRLRKHIDSLSAFLGNKEFLMGYVTVADLELVHMIQLCDWLSNASGLDDPFLSTPNLMNLRKNVLKLPGITEYTTTPQARSMVWMKKGSCRFEKAD